MIHRHSGRLLAPALLAALAVAAAADDLRGPEFGSGKITSAIESLTDRPDVDDYTAVLLPGEELTVKVSAAKKSDARFVVTVFDPSGADRTGSGVVKTKKDGAKVQIKGLPIDAAGRWTVRIEARDGAEGGYQAAFKIRPPKPVKIKKQVLAGAAGVPAVATHAVGAAEGGALDLKLKWGKKDTPVELTDVAGPLGTLTGVFGEAGALRVKSRGVQLKKHPLDAGIGTHVVELACEGTATYSLTLGVTPPQRVGGKRELFGVNDPQLDPIAAPVRSAPDQLVRITGRNFSLSPVPSVFIGANQAQVVEVGPARTYVDVLAPPGEDGSTQDLTVVNPDGQAAYHPAYFFYVPEAVVESVTQVSGPELGDGQVKREGGAVFEVRGRNFVAADVATVNDDVVTKDAFTGTLFRFTVPAGDAGLVTFRLTDVFGRVQTVGDLARRVGFEESTAATLPAPSENDDLSAWDGLIGDLDNDGRVDDLLIVTYNENSRTDVLYGPDPNGVYLGGVPVPENPVGDREVFTRLFFRQPDGRLADVTDANLPARGSDASGFDDLNALAVAVADIDGDDVNDIVLGGSAGIGEVSDTFARIRVLLNDGSGGFTHSGLVFDPGYLPLLIAYDETYDPNAQEPTGIYNVADERAPARTVTALAVGDLDGDGHEDVVAGSPDFSTRIVRYDPGPVDLTQNPPYISSGDVSVIDVDGRAYYYSATQVFTNRLDEGGGMEDVTGAVLPSVGTAADPGHVSYRARHLLVGDVDDDDDLDIVVTWNNPASLVPASAERSFGSYPRYSYGVYQYRFDAATAQEVASTRILLNDGEGTFTDETATWLPSPSGDEFWHAHRMALADLDGDDDLDLVLLHRRALNAYRYLPGVPPPAITRPSLRVLRNDGTGFTDVTATAVPSAITGPASRGRALAVGDIDLDGLPEIAFAASPDPDDARDTRAPPHTRVLWNRGGLRFELNDAFLLPASTDSGEAHALLVGDVDRDGLPALHLIGEHTPDASAGGALQRIHEWQR